MRGRRRAGGAWPLPLIVTLLDMTPASVDITSSTMRSSAQGGDLREQSMPGPRPLQCGPNTLHEPYHIRLIHIHGNRAIFSTTQGGLRASGPHFDHLRTGHGRAEMTATTQRASCTSGLGSSRLVDIQASRQRRGRRAPRPALLRPMTRPRGLGGTVPAIVTREPGAALCYSSAAAWVRLSTDVRRATDGAWDVRGSWDARSVSRRPARASPVMLIAPGGRGRRRDGQPGPDAVAVCPY